MLIAEIGNSHCGNLSTAKELIYQAKESGADLIKTQVFDPETINGSMPRGFYHDCAFTEKEFLELYEFADKMGIELFVTFFTPEYQILKTKMKYKKLSRPQAVNLKDQLKFYDSKEYFISIPKDHKIPKMFNATILYVNDYMIDFDDSLDTINKLQEHCSNKVGLSDHTVNLTTCLRAINDYGVKTIEKHFCLEEQKNNIYHDGQLFRDSVHSATPKDFAKIAKELGK